MTTMDCADLDRALEASEAGLPPEMARHAAGCAACRRRIEIWNAIAAAAPSLSRTWESPALWPRIEAALREEALARAAAPPRPERARIRRSGPALLLRAAAIAVVALPLLLLLRIDLGGNGPADAGDDFLTERALTDVEAAEADYVRSIEALSRIAEPRIENPESLLLLNYREKLRILDQAIAECRAGVDGNPRNAHLRRELLAMYREKTETLKGLIGEEGHDVH